MEQPPKEGGTLLPPPSGEGSHPPPEGMIPGDRTPPPAPQPQPNAPEEPLAKGGGSLAGVPLPNPSAEVGGTGVEPPPPARSPPREEARGDFYSVKWIRWKGEQTPIITQSQNGPCPLLAIINVLCLQWKVKLSPQKEVTTAEELMAHLGDCILAAQPREPSEGLELNFQQNINDSMMVLPKLVTGLDVNVRFTGVSDFEYTPECIIFDLLNIPLYHGWLVDPQNPQEVQAVGKLSYNQLVEKIITSKQAPDSSLVSEGMVAEQFLETTASQLTQHGLQQLRAAAKEEELSVFFRNNHFSTMVKHKEEGVVWETLQRVDGDSRFCDTHFHPRQPTGKEGGATAAPPNPHPHQRQVDQDFLLALSLQGVRDPQDPPPVLSDLELAQQLQQEEYQHLPPPQGGRAAGERRPRQKPELDCTLL